MFKKLTELITPAPKKSPEPPAAPPAPPPAPTPDLSTTLKPILRRLTSAPTLEDTKAQEALAELKQLGLKRGLYVTAFEIRTQLDMLPRVDSDGAHHQKERGYVLAGDFFYAHIHREIQAIRTKSQPVGPNIFKGYCGEMVECLVRTGNAPRAVEVPVLVVDDLLANAVDLADKSEIFLELAQQAVTSIATIMSHYFDLQSGEGMPRPTQAPRPSAATPLPRGFTSSFDEGMIAYVQDLQRKLREIKTKAAKLPGVITPLAPAGPGTAGTFKTPLERDQALLTLANAAQYLPFCGIVKERISSLLLAAQPAKAVTFLRSAGDSYETQGDIEVDVHFTKLPAKRYQKAYELYARARDDERAARVQSKYDKLQSQRRTLA